MKPSQLIVGAGILAVLCGTGLFANPSNSAEIKQSTTRSCKELGEVPNSWLSTDETDRSNLLPGQWLESDREDSPRNNRLSFWKASELNALQGNSCAYKSIAQRHEFYDFADAYLNSKTGAKKSRWFKAANIVTAWNAIGAAERINAWYLTDSTDSFLVRGNQYLFSKNIKNFRYLMRGEEVPGCRGLAGKDLDYCLVDFEQGELQGFMDGYSRSELLSVSKDLSYSFSSVAAPSKVKKSMSSAFPNGGFDFLQEDHRVRLGKAMIDQLYP